MVIMGEKGLDVPCRLALAGGGWWLWSCFRLTWWDLLLLGGCDGGRFNPLGEEKEDPRHDQH